MASELCRAVSSALANDAAVLVPDEPMSTSELPPVDELTEASSLSQKFDTLGGRVSRLEKHVRSTEKTISKQKKDVGTRGRTLGDALVVYAAQLDRLEGIVSSVACNQDRRLGVTCVAPVAFAATPCA